MCVYKPINFYWDVHEFSKRWWLYKLNLFPFSKKEFENKKKVEREERSVKIDVFFVTRTMTPNRSLEQPNLTSDKRGPANDSSPSPSTAPFAESTDSCDSLVLIRLNRDVTSPSFRFDSRADVSLTHRTGRVGREEKRGNEGTNHHKPTAYRCRTDIRNVRPRDRRDGGCPR